MVKKQSLLCLFLVLIFIQTSEGATRFIARYAYFQPADNIFREIYGNGHTFGGELNIDVMKYADIWFGWMYYSKKSKLPLTGEDTVISLLPLEAGLKLKYPTKFITPYFGGGIVYNYYSESNNLGYIRDSGTGYCIVAGFYIFTCRSRRCAFNMNLDFFINYTRCLVKPVDIEVNIGGTRIGIGWGFEF